MMLIMYNVEVFELFEIILVMSKKVCGECWVLLIVVLVCWLEVFEYV